MLTNQQLNQCFEILAAATDADNAMEKISEIFQQYEGEKIGSELVTLISRATNIDYEDATQIKSDVFSRRNSALKNFLSLPAANQHFNKVSSDSWLPMAEMLSNFMIWERDVILSVIAATENIGSYEISAGTNSRLSVVEFNQGGASSVNKDSLLENFLEQRAFGENTPHAGEVAILLLEGGCKIDYRNTKNIKNLTETRAFDSKLVLNLCLHEVNKNNNPELLFSLVRRVEALEELKAESSRASAASSSRLSRASGQDSGIDEIKRSSMELIKKVITAAIESQKINTAKANTDSRSLTIVSFILERSNLGKATSQSIWSYIQAKDRLGKLLPEIFANDENLLHAVIASNNRLLLDFAMSGINHLSSDLQTKVFIEYVNRHQESPFVFSCKIGLDEAISRLFDKISEIAPDQLTAELESGLMACAKNGKANSFKILTQKYREKNIPLPLHNIFIKAILHNQETISEFLIKELKVDLNCEALIEDEKTTNIKTVCALEAAILANNLTLITSLIKYGAEFENQDSYLQYKQELEEGNKTQDLEALNKAENSIGNKKKEVSSISEYVNGINSTRGLENFPKLQSLLQEQFLQYKSEALFLDEESYSLLMRSITSILPISRMVRGDSDITDEMIELIRKGKEGDVLESLQGSKSNSHAQGASSAPSSSASSATVSSFFHNLFNRKGGSER